MTQTFTIGQLASQVDLPTKTIRFYEDIGLIAPAKRAQNGYRMYSTQSVSELTLIKYARDIGLPIPKIKKLLQGREKNDCTHSKEYVEKEITEYISLLENKIGELQSLKKQLTKLTTHISDLKNCDENDAYCCNILGYLAKLKGGE